MRILLALWVGVLACSKSEPTSDGPAPFPQAEAERGRTACEAYAERVCRCAETTPTLAQECEAAKPRPEALELVLSAALAEGLSRESRAATAAEARKIIASCIEHDAKLDPDSCPRPAAR